MSVKLPALAYYYIWWTPSAWVDSVTDTPLLGFYRSSDVIAQHIDWAKEHGIEGFFVSYWDDTAYSRGLLSQLVEVAGMKSFKLAIMTEWMRYGTEPYDTAELEAMKNELRYLIDTYGANPVFKWAPDGRMPIFVYNTYAVGGNTMTDIIHTMRSEGRDALFLLDAIPSATGFDWWFNTVGFDGVMYYTAKLSSWNSVWEVQKPNIRKYPEKLWGLPAAPGFDNTLTRARINPEPWINWNEWHNTQFAESTFPDNSPSVLHAYDYSGTKRLAVTKQGQYLPLKNKELVMTFIVAVDSVDDDDFLRCAMAARMDVLSGFDPITVWDPWKNEYVDVTAVYTEFDFFTGRNTNTMDGRAFRFEVVGQVEPGSGFRTFTVDLTQTLIEHWGQATYDKCQLLYIAPTIEVVNGSATIEIEDVILNSTGWVQDRLDGQYYRDFLNRVLSLEPDFIVVNSWNEWLENSQIEPGTGPHMGSDPTLYLKITKEYFNPSTYTLTLTPSPYGLTDPPTGEYMYLEGRIASVAAIPKAGYSFDHWDLNGASHTENPIQVAMTADATLTPYFSEIQPPPPGKRTLVITAGTGGSTSPAPGGYQVDEGASQAVTATASAGYAFTGWLLDGNPIYDNPIAVLMDADHSLYAEFTPTPISPLVNVLKTAVKYLGPLGVGLYLIGRRRG